MTVTVAVPGSGPASGPGPAGVRGYGRAARSFPSIPVPSSASPEASLSSRRGFVVGVRLATAGAVFFAAYYPVMAVGEILSEPTTSTAAVWWAAALVLPILALHVGAVWAVVHGRDLRRGALTVAALAAVVVVGLPLTGWTGYWLDQTHVVLATAVLLLRGRWRALAVAACLAGVVWVVVARDAGLQFPWLVLWRAGETLAFTGFALVLHRLEAARESLATEALLAERRRIDDQLDRALGRSIATIAAEAGALARSDGAVTAAEIEAVTALSRATSGQVRRVVRDYRRSSVAEELDATARLLTDAGIPTTVDVPDDLEPADAAAVRRELPAAVAALLADRSARACVLSVELPGPRLVVERVPS